MFFLSFFAHIAFTHSQMQSTKCPYRCMCKCQNSEWSVFCMCISENTIICRNGWPASLVELLFFLSSELNIHGRKKDETMWQEKKCEYINYCCTCFQYAVLRNGARISEEILFFFSLSLSLLFTIDFNFLILYQVDLFPFASFHRKE